MVSKGGNLNYTDYVIMFACLNYLLLNVVPRNLNKSFCSLHGCSQMGLSWASKKWKICEKEEIQQEDGIPSTTCRPVPVIFFFF